MASISLSHPYLALSLSHSLAPRQGNALPGRWLGNRKDKPIGKLRKAERGKKHGDVRDRDHKPDRPISLDPRESGKLLFKPTEMDKTEEGEDHNAYPRTEG